MLSNYYLSNLYNINYYVIGRAIISNIMHNTINNYSLLIWLLNALLIGDFRQYTCIYNFIMSRYKHNILSFIYSYHTTILKDLSIIPANVNK